MTENNELGKVNFENQEERREDDCHDCVTQQQNSELSFAYIMDSKI